ARSMSLPIHMGGPKDASLTERPFEDGCRVLGMDRDGRSHDSAPVVNGLSCVGRGRVTQCPTCPKSNSAEGVEMAAVVGVQQVLTEGEADAWWELRDSAAEAALDLLMSSVSEGLHEDFRPTELELRTARNVMIRWLEVASLPLPE